MPGDKAGRVLFVGNIPYGLTEEQIMHLFSSAGEVVNFRLVYDKESGRPKGFGFLEFADADAAASAVRNLNGHEIQGRTLRVDYSNDDGTKDSAPSNSNQSNGGHQPQLSQQQHQQHPFQLPQGQQQTNGQFPHFQQGNQSVDLPALVPRGVDLPPNVTAADQISQTLGQFDPPQLLDFISQMKNYLTTDPQQATALLTQNQSLCYAMFQALLLLDLVDSSTLAQVVQMPNSSASNSAAPTHPYQAPPPVQFQQGGQPQQQQYGPPPGQPPQIPGQYLGGYQQQPPNMSTPPVQQGYQPPPRPANVTEDTWIQITQICMLQQAQVDAMTNPQEREAVNNIRAQYSMYFTGQAAGQ